MLQIKKVPGNERKIKGEALADLQRQLQTPEGFRSYGAIVEWLQEKHGLTVEYGTVYSTVRYLLGGKLKVPRPQSHQQNGQVVETFKKLGAALVALESLLAQGKVIHYLCQDESRVGLKTQSGKVITAKGVKPKIEVK